MTSPLYLANLAAWRAIAEDEALPCKCGEPPYTDGNLCPKCWAAFWVKKLEAMISRPVAGGSPRLRGRRPALNGRD